MSGYFANAHGAPCPTLVLDGQGLPEETDELLDSLTAIRADLSADGAGDVLKNAIVRPSAHPLFDLDYRFVQSLPQSHASFDLRGSCGHSILAAVEAAARSGMIPPLVPGARVRVNVLNNGDNVVCEVEETSDGGTSFTAHFLCTPTKPYAELLMTGEPVTEVRVDRMVVPVSLVSMGNPYVFVPARHLGVETKEQLFAADGKLFDQFARIRLAVCEQQGWDPSGAFPKIAAVLPQEGGALAVRAVSVPSWHPTLALTGAICLGTAVGIEGTIPWSLAWNSGYREGLVTLVTPGGELQVSASSVRTDTGPRLAWVSVAGKRVDYQGWAGLPAARFPYAAAPSLSTSPSSSQERACLPLPV
ncbi:PrpF domain-containing protein [Streptomyces sp. NPDC101132]|uniref:PrpF domain-containing protein n=1 Tax=Streptomyces sp. NPDC101132 TaxID=3366110 RepID=UPI0037F9DDA4